MLARKGRDGALTTRRHLSLNPLPVALPSAAQVPGGFKPLLIPVGGTVGANIDGSKVVESIGSLLTKGGLKR